jgi:hypothetical protein
MPALLTRMSTPLSCSCIAPIMSLLAHSFSMLGTSHNRTGDTCAISAVNQVLTMHDIADHVHCSPRLGRPHLMAAGLRRSALVCATCIVQQRVLHRPSHPHYSCKHLECDGVTMTPLYLESSWVTFTPNSSPIACAACCSSLGVPMPCMPTLAPAAARARSMPYPRPCGDTDPAAGSITGSR